MKFSCLQENLSKGIQTALSAISKESGLPILSTLLLKVEHNSLIISATNLEIGITSIIRGKVETDGCVAIDARIFAEYISLLPKEKVELEVTDQFILHITCENYSTKIRGVNPEDFPLIPSCERTSSFHFVSQELKKSIQSTLFVVSSHERIQPELRGLYFYYSPTQKTITFAGSDGHRLTEKEMQVESTMKEEYTSIIPLKTAQELLKILSYYPEGSCDLWVSDTQILFICDQTEITSKLIHGTYPDYKSIIPTTTSTKVVLEVKEAMKAFKTVGLFSKNDVYDITLEFSSLSEGRGELTCRASNATLGEGNVVVPIEIKGSNQEIILNYKYLTEGLSQCDDERISFELIDNNQPCLLRPLKQKNSLYLVMPIRE